MYGREWDMMPPDVKEKYVSLLRSRTPEQSVRKMCELSDMVTQMLIAGIKHNNPELTDKQVRGRLAYLKFPKELADKVVEELDLK